MEAKTEKKTIIKILKRPHGKVIQFASWGLMAWGVDESGRKYVKWGNDEEWSPACPKEKEEEKEEKKRRKRRKMIYFPEEAFFCF